MVHARAPGRHEKLADDRRLRFDVQLYTVREAHVLVLVHVSRRYNRDVHFFCLAMVVYIIYFEYNQQREGNIIQLAMQMFLTIITE